MCSGVYKHKNIEMKRSILALLLCAMTGVAVSAQVTFTEENSWDALQKKAASESKYILVDGYTDWCYWCKVQDKELFSQKKVGDFVGENFVAAKINFEKEEGLDFSRKFRTWAYPTLLVFNNGGQLVDKIVGYTEDADEFIGKLQAMLDNKNKKNFSFDSKNLKPDFPDFYVDNIGPGKKDPVVDTKIYEFLDKQESLLSETAWSVLYRFGGNEKHNEFFVANYDKVKEMYGAIEAEDYLRRMVMEGAQSSAEAKDKSGLEAAVKNLSLLNDKEAEADLAQQAELLYYKQSKDWETYFGMMDKIFLDSDYKNEGQVNSVAWGVYENHDQPYVDMATEWMRVVINRSDSYYFWDTYAALLLKQGKLQKAEHYAKEAIKRGKKEETSVKETEALLKKIQEKAAVNNKKMTEVKE